MRLRTKASFLLAIIVIVALSVTGLLYIRFLEVSLKNSILGGLESISSLTSENISKFLDGAMKDAQTVASNLPVKALREKDARLIEEHLKALAEFFPKFGNGMFVLDSDGTLWADYPTHPKAKGRSFAFREYFQRTMKEQKGIIGTPYTSFRTSDPVLTFTALLRGPSNEILGIFGCSVPLLDRGALGDFSKTRIGQTGYLYVYDSTRLIILHPDEERILKRDVPPNANKLFDQGLLGFEGVGETVNSRGVPMLACLRRIPGTDWIIIAQQPQSEAFAPLRAAESMILNGILTAGLIAVCIGWLAIRGITSPLEKLREAVLRLGFTDRENESDTVQGEEAFRQQLGEITVRDEIGDLANAFKDLSERLDQSLGLLRSSARDWERTFNSVADAIYILDEESRIVRLNRSASNLLKVNFNEAIGRPCYELMHGTDKPPEFCPHRKTIST
ncbi:MAG: sensor histidine kinase, partial [Deltaproteobacteria bacterium]